MRRRRRVWYGMLIGYCFLLLVGCSEENLSEDDQVLQGGTEPTVTDLGLRLIPVPLNLTGLSAAALAQVARGSYLVNGVAGCPGCHTLPGAGYMAGGFEFPLPFLPPDIQGFTSVFARNLTPDPETGMQLTENAFIEVMRTGKDFTDSTATDPQRLIIMPWHAYRFMSLEDLRAMFAFLQRLPPVPQAIRTTYKPPFPFPPIPLPAIGDSDAVNDPANAERGLRIPAFFSSGPAATAFNDQFTANVAGLTVEARSRVGRGSYLVNALMDCSSCHTDGAGDGIFDGGLVPGTVDVNTVAYLSGGVDIGALLGLDAILSRNLTPSPMTGLFLNETQFIQTLQFGADFRRPGASLRVVPHFPVEFHLVGDDLRAVFAYLQTIPAVAKAVNIAP